MQTKIRNKFSKGTWLMAALIVISLIMFSNSPAQAQTSIDLCATTGSTTMPDGTVVPIWSYVLGDCTTSTTAQLPGPTITANEGDAVTIILHNNLLVPTALLLQGQAIIPDRTGAPAGGTATYNFTATAPGTYLYEAGLVPGAEYQTAMGMYGALVVQSATAGQAYDDTTTAFDDEAVLVLSEIDPNVNNSSNPALYDLRNFAPRYFLINGKAYPDTDPVPTVAGNRLLLRYVNAGLQYHSMALLGPHQTVIANDGSLLTYSHRMVAETFGPGQTADIITTIPATTADGSQFALYDGSFLLHNSSTAGFGGMLTFVTVGVAPPPGVDITGPETNNVTLIPNPADGSVAVDLAASVSDIASGGSNIGAAEYFVDAIGTDGAGCAMTGAFTSPSEAVSATIPVTGTTPPCADLTTLPGGNHTFYVHGLDSAGNWGTTNFAVLNLDKTGPASTGLTLAPNPTNGLVDVALQATGDDSTTGGSDIVAAEYFIDAAGGETPGTGTAMTVNGSAPIASLNATIPAATVLALAEGMHAISVRSQDALGNWGSFGTTDLLVDKTAPVTNFGVDPIVPNPNNGTLPVNASTPAVRVTAVFSDSASNVNAAEAFIDTPGADGTGFVFAASDGLYDSPTETGYGDIPLATVVQLSDGAHDIYVHGQDAAGNWGAVVSTTLVVDKTSPVVSNVLADPNPTEGATSVALTALVTDSATNIVMAEWFTGTDPGTGNGNAMAAVDGTFDSLNEDLTATIDVSTWADDTYTLNVRAKDAAGNWSSTSSTDLVVGTAPPPPASPVLAFSTAGTAAVPGVGGPFDAADVYAWDGTAFSRQVDVSSIGMPAGVNVDGLAVVSPTEFYISISGGVGLPGIPIAQDEDILYYDNGVWTVYFDGTAQGLTAGTQDLDAIDIVGGVIYFSTLGNASVPGVAGPFDDADIYAWDGANFSRVFTALANGLPAGANVDGLTIVDATHLYLSFNAANTSVPGIGNVQDEDVVEFNAGTWSVYFDGTAQGLTAGGQDLDAIDIP